MSAVAHQQVRFHVHAQRAESIDLAEQGFRIDHHSVAGHPDLVWSQDAAWDLRELVGTVGDLHRVPGIVAALAPNHHDVVLDRQVNHLDLVAPLEAQDC